MSTFEPEAVGRPTPPSSGLRVPAGPLNWPGKFVVLPRERTPKHLLLPINTAQHVVASSERICAELGYEVWSKLTKRYGESSLGSSETRQAPSIRRSLITILKMRLSPTRLDSERFSLEEARRRRTLYERVQHVGVVRCSPSFV